MPVDWIFRYYRIDHSACPTSVRCALTDVALPNDNPSGSALACRLSGVILSRTAPCSVVEIDPPADHVDHTIGRRHLRLSRNLPLFRSLHYDRRPAPLLWVGLSSCGDFRSRTPLLLRRESVAVAIDVDRNVDDLRGGCPGLHSSIERGLVRRVVGGIRGGIVLCMRTCLIRARAVGSAVVCLQRREGGGRAGGRAVVLDRDAAGKQQGRQDRNECIGSDISHGYLSIISV